jgi:photosystem II stability/assembly factor-like uncharacterized protein
MDANTGVVVGYGQMILRTTNGGGNWSIRSTGNDYGVLDRDS